MEPSAVVSGRSTLAAARSLSGGPYLVIRPTLPSIPTFADLKDSFGFSLPVERQRSLVLLLAALLMPSALIAFTMAFWVIASDLRWTGEFFLSGGLFSHWQVWLSSAGVLLLSSRLLDRLARKQTE